MAEELSRYKVTLRLMSLLTVLGWVAFASSMATQKSDIIEVHDKCISELEDRVKKCEQDYANVKGDIREINTNIRHILKAIDRVEKKVENGQSYSTDKWSE